MKKHLKMYSLFIIYSGQSRPKNTIYLDQRVRSTRKTIRSCTKIRCFSFI